ncbi:hypothetical protein CcI49_16480 [Frankia sp. CcI49]|uniref:putative leader peptide n=1 Tax=Frankiaceae TaxID=74712 RepID=UPI0006DA7546|nr:putative leader peptide [Parafrankia sp. CH37]KPM51205.1 hypothetical protein ACG83_34165 [Frankia sp. R43]ONH59565.1 hypothetical protein CcI49_16480 [Frankia sp. CcI49]
MASVTARVHALEPSGERRMAARRRRAGAFPVAGLSGLGASSRVGLMPRPTDVGPIDPRLVARLHVDLLRVSSAGCRRSR